MALLHKGDPGVVYSQPMHEHSICGQHSEPVKAKYILHGEIVYSFTRVNHKRRAFRRSRICPCKIAAQSERVCPSIALNNPDRKVLALQFQPKRIMMADRSDAAKQVPDASPPEADMLRYLTIGMNYIGKRRMNIFAPVYVIPVWRMS